MMRRGASSGTRPPIPHEPGTPSRVLKENTAASRENGRWKIVDRRSRQFPFFSDGSVISPWMSLDQAAEAGRYMQAVKQFLRTGDNGFLAAFSGKGIRDTSGKFHPFELDETPSTNSIIAVRR